MPLGDLDPSRPMIVSAWGRKGSGKSVFNRRLYQSYPFDKVAIDVNGNAEPGDDAEQLTGPVPDAFPAAPARNGRRVTRNLHYRADPGSDTYVDDLDRAVGWVCTRRTGRRRVWAGEVGEFMAHRGEDRPAHAPVADAEPALPHDGVLRRAPRGERLPARARAE